MNQNYNTSSVSGKNMLFLSAFTAVVLAITGCGSAPDVMVPPTPVSNNAIEGGTSAPVETTNPNATPVSSSEPTATPSTPPTTPAMKRTVYKNGTYSAVGEYMSPGGPEEIGVSLTLVNDVVTEATVVPKATVMISVKMQKAFEAGYKQYVIGKNIDTINVGKVSGSSLTPLGFNDAVAKIKAQAV